MFSTASVVPKLCCMIRNLILIREKSFLSVPLSLHIIQADSGPTKPAAEWILLLFPLEVSGWGTEGPLTSISC